MRNLTLLLLLVITATAVNGQTVANYTFSASAGAYTQIQGTGGSVSPALSGGTTDDGWYNSIPIGFTFIFEGAGYTTISASTNGWARLGGTLTAAAFVNNINSGTSRPLVAPLWDDLETPTGNFTYTTTGVAPNRICTLEWLNAEWNYNSTSAISFQVKLHESSRAVEFVYRQQAGALNAPTASIGIGGATSGQFLSLNNSGASPTASSAFETTGINTKPATGQIYRFDHYAYIPVVTSVTPVTGNVNTIITISGNGFSAVPSQNVVHCGAMKATVTSSSLTQITASVPAGTTLDRVTVTNTASNRTGESQQIFDVTYACPGTINTSSFSTFLTYATSAGGRTSATMDLDLDGKPEVVIGLGSTATVFRNTSTPGTINASSLAAGVGFTVSGGSFDTRFFDLDGDGKKEIITANSDDSISVLRNTSTPGAINAGSFANRVNFSVGSSSRVDACDVDGDGRPELIACSRTNNRIEVRQNLTTPGVINLTSFAAPIYFTTGDSPYDIRVADFDGDNKTDVIVCNYWDSTVSVFRNTSAMGVINGSSFAAKVDFWINDKGMDLDIADIDGDGKLDILCMNQNYTLSVLRNTGTPGTLSFAPVQIISTGPLSNIAMAIGDVNGDGKPDLAITVGSISNRVAVFRNQSTPGVISFAPLVYFFIQTDGFDVGIGDIDCDGRPEIIAAHLSQNMFSLLQNVSNSFTTIAPLSVLGATTYCTDGIWDTYHDPSDNTKALFAVKDNGNNLGTITVDEYRDAAPGNYLGIRYLQRHFRVTPTTQPLTPVQVRLYFTNAELTNLMAVDPTVTSVASLSVTKYNGPTEDATYNPLDATSLVWYPQASITTGTAYGGRYLEFTISSFSEFWIHGNTGVLPIELLSFDAEPVNHTVNLTWQTASETNNDYFTVERSRDGNTVESIDTIDGAGNSTTLIDYQTTDPLPFDGSSYYRLKQVDFNGHFTYSEWKNVMMETPEMIKVFPNPSDGNIYLTLTGDADVLWTTTVVDITGQIVYETVAPRAESQQVKLNIPPGSYVLLLRSSTINISQQLVITD